MPAAAVCGAGTGVCTGCCAPASSTKISAMEMAFMVRTSTAGWLAGYAWRNLHRRVACRLRMALAVTGRPNCELFTTVFQLGYRSEEHTSELQSLRHLVCRL